MSALNPFLLPPGLQGLPREPRRFPVGNALELLRNPPWEVVERLKQRHGPMCLAWLGPSPVVFLFDPDAIGRVLVEGDRDGDVYKKEPTAALEPIAHPDTSTFTLNGDAHKKLRSQGAHSHGGYRAWLDEASDRVVALSAERASALAPVGPDLDVRLRRFVFDALGLTLLGEPFSDDAYKDAMTVYDAIDLRMRTQLPVLPLGFSAAKGRWLQVFIRRVAEVSKGERPAAGAVQHLMPGSPLSPETFAISLAQMVPGGFFSVASVVLNALGALAQHAEVQESLVTAVRAEAAKGGPFDRSRLAAITLLEQIVRETARLFTPVPLYFRRVGPKPLRLGAHELPPGTQIAIGPGAMHHDAGQWPEPKRFLPSRWTKELLAERPFGSAWFMPFGRGGRECEGRGIALTLIRACVFGLLAKGRPQLEGPPSQRFHFAVMTPGKMTGGLKLE